MAYKTFTNGSPLPASDLMTYLMNQSVMVFADATARSAALTAPTEGMITYLEDTGLVYVYNGSSWVDINDNSGAIPKSTVTTAGDLIVADGSASVTRLGIGANGSIPRVDSGALGYLPVGTDGQILTVSSGAPTWTTPAGGANLNWSQISSVSPTGTKTVSFTGLSGKDNYQLLFNELSFVSDSNLFVRINNDSGSNYNYYGYRFNRTGSYSASTTVQSYASGNDSRFYLGYVASSSANIKGGLRISGGNAGGQKVIDGLAHANDTNSEGFIIQGRYSTNTTISSIEVYTDIGNFDSGSVVLLGA